MSAASQIKWPSEQLNTYTRPNSPEEIVGRFGVKIVAQIDASQQKLFFDQWLVVQAKAEDEGKMFTQKLFVELDCLGGEDESLHPFPGIKDGEGISINQLLWVAPKRLSVQLTVFSAVQGRFTQITNQIQVPRSALKAARQASPSPN